MAIQCVLKQKHPNANRRVYIDTYCWNYISLTKLLKAYLICILLPPPLQVMGGYVFTGVGM